MQGINPLTGCCTYKTPCGWCTKWDKKCDKKIGYDTPQDTTLDYNKYLHELECAVNQIDYVDRYIRMYVKVTTKFNNYLKKLYNLDHSHQTLDILASALGVIVEIDDEINHPCYEIEYATETATNKICQSEEDHQWECCGMSTGGSTYRCKICGKHKTEPIKRRGNVTISTHFNAKGE